MRKRILSAVLALCLAAGLLPVNARAEEAVSGSCGTNLTWTLARTGSQYALTLTISGTGEMENYTPEDSSPWSWAGRIITSVSIGPDVTSIGNYAFSRCSNLTSVTIPDGVTSIGTYAFYDCDSLTSVTIPDGVTSIAEGVFSECGALTSVTIPDSVTSIGKNAFSKCSYLDVTIPKNVTSIGESAFSECGLRSVAIPNGVTSIGEYVFYWCNRLTNVTIPDGVTSIGISAFNKCFNLTSVTIPNSVTSIGVSAFYDCRSLTSVTIPDGVTSIKSQVFCGCSNLTSVTIPDGVTSIGSRAFSGCPSLTSVTIPDGVTSIGEYAFNKCNKLTQMDIPESVTHIGNCAFRECSGLTGIQVNEDNLNYASKEGVLFTKDTKTLVAYPGGKSGSSYNVPDGVTQIEDYAFYKCGSLTEVGIPESMTRIGTNSFSKCDSLTDVYYEGTQKQWQRIYGTSFSSSPTIHYGKCDIEVKAKPQEGGNVSGGDSYTKNGSATVTAQANTGYEFKEWEKNGTSVSTDAAYTFPVTEDQTLVAVFQRVSYDVTFDPNYVGASANPPVPVGSGGTVPKPADPSRAGYDFSGWFTEADCQTEWNFDTGKVTKDITLYARWAQRYTVTFDSQGGAVDPVSAMTDGSGRLSELPIPSYDACHSFEGWYTDSDQLVDKDNTVFTQDTTIYAKWKEKHTPVELPREEATCTVPGKTEGSKCSVCGKVLNAQTTIVATGHTPAVVSGKAATCTEKGLTDGSTCSVCGTVIKKQEEIPAKGHTEVVVPAVQPTCNTPGSTEGKKCSVCGTFLITPQEIPATGKHVPGTVISETIKTPATCSTDGVKTIRYPCDVCHQEFEKEETIPAAHTEVKVLAGKPAACEEAGLTEGSHCTACGKTLVEQKTIPALGHDWIKSGSGSESIIKAPTCEEDGSKSIDGAKCSRCDAVSKAITVTIPRTGHSWSEETAEVTKAATCTEGGVRTYTRRCTVEGCGKTETRTETIPATGHSYGAWSTTKAPTATQTGTRERVCASCGDKQTETIPATGGSTPAPDESKVYTVTFDANGGTGGTTQTTGTDGKLSALPAAPARTGYSFSGWFTAASGGVEVTTSTVFSGSATVYAHWRQSAPSDTLYQIYAPGRITGGSVSASHSFAAEGTSVTVRVSAQNGYNLERLSAVSLSTGQELRLTSWYSGEYVFAMPAGPVMVNAAFNGWNSGTNAWYVPEQPPANTKPVKWYFKDGQIWHVTDGLVPHNAFFTRDMLVSILYNMDPDSFGDPTVWADTHGIVPDIYGNWLWGKDKVISREQTAAILLCYAQHMGYNTSQRASLNGYTDSGQIRSAAWPAMSWSRAVGLMTGTSNTTLSPQSVVNCGQANIILSRFLSNVAGA